MQVMFTKVAIVVFALRCFCLLRLSVFGSLLSTTQTQGSSHREESSPSLEECFCVEVHFNSIIMSHPH